MERLIKRKGVIVLLSTLFLGLTGCQSNTETIELNVSAASSLQESVTELAELFMEEHPHVTIRLNFAGSNQLQQQIAEGFPVDVFLSAHLEPVENLVEVHLVKQYVPFTTSPVVLVTSIPEITTIYDLANEYINLIFASENVPIGIYTDLILNHIDLERARFREDVLNNVISRAANVRQALLYVAIGEADATFVYLTDLTDEVLEDVTVIELPQPYQVVGTFYLALIDQEKISDMAHMFYEFVLSNAGQEILSQHGFR